MSHSLLSLQVKLRVIHRTECWFFQERTIPLNQRLSTTEKVPNNLLSCQLHVHLFYSASAPPSHVDAGNIRNRIKSTVVAHLQKCSANALIIFDEAQKFAPSALDVLLPGLRETGSLSVSGEESVSTTNTIFLFISDIGTNITLNLLLKYGDREAIPHTELRHEMKKALDVQWDSLAFSRTIKEIVPFLHMEMKQIEEVFPIKISEMVDSVMSDHWHKLIISAELIQYLSGPPFVSYDKYKARNSRIIAVASYGARGLTNTGNFSIL